MKRLYKSQLIENEIISNFPSLFFLKYLHYSFSSSKENLSTICYTIIYYNFTIPFCCSLVAKSPPTLCDPTDCTTPGFPVLHYLPGLPKLMSIESVMLSNHLNLCCPLLLLHSIFPSLRVFFQRVNSSHQVAKIHLDNPNFTIFVNFIVPYHSWVRCSHTFDYDPLSFLMKKFM